MSDQTETAAPAPGAAPLAYPAEAVLTAAEVRRWLRVSPRQFERLNVPCAHLGARTRRYVAGDVLAYLRRRTG